MTDAPLQIPLDWVEPEQPSLENFIVGDNDELVTQLYGAIAAPQQPSVVSIWSGPETGKTYLLRAVESMLLAQGKRALRIAAGELSFGDPFDAWDGLLIDDAGHLNESKQALAFNAFVGMTGRASVVVATGRAPPLQWPIRDDLRSRLGSGIVLELHSPREEDVPEFVKEHARRRGFTLSQEVLTYLLTQEKRDLAHLGQVISELDRWALASKRRVTVPLARAYLAHKRGESSKGEPSH